MATNGSNDGRNDAGAGEDAVDIKFSHVHLYVDSVLAVSDYKELEAAMNQFHSTLGRGKKGGVTGVVAAADIDEGRRLWESVQGTENDAFQPHGRDVIKVRPLKICTSRVSHHNIFYCRYCSVSLHL